MESGAREVVENDTAGATKLFREDFDLLSKREVVLFWLSYAIMPISRCSTKSSRPIRRVFEDSAGDKVRANSVKFLGSSTGASYRYLMAAAYHCCATRQHDQISLCVARGDRCCPTCWMTISIISGGSWVTFWAVA